MTLDKIFRIFYYSYQCQLTQHVERGKTTLNQFTTSYPPFFCLSAVTERRPLTKFNLIIYCCSFLLGQVWSRFFTSSGTHFNPSKSRRFSEEAQHTRLMNSYVLSTTGVVAAIKLPYQWNNMQIVVGLTVDLPTRIAICHRLRLSWH